VSNLINLKNNITSLFCHVEPSPLCKLEAKEGRAPFSPKKLLKLSGIENGTLLTDEDSFSFLSGVLGINIDIHSKKKRRQ
jgi:hypothetical protein